jgi:hypothetical protein
LTFPTSSVGAANDIQSVASETAKQKMDDVSSQAGQKANQVRPCSFVDLLVV